MTRRTFICGVASVIPAVQNKQRADMEAVQAVDHLLLGVSDLDHGIAWVEQKTGVKAMIGGTHPGVGTRNALLSLGSRHYLEIIAPDPAQSAYNFNIDVRGLTEPRLVNWAAATTDIESVAASARKAGYQLFGPRPGSRQTPSGKTLRWKSMGVLTKTGGDGIEPVPFFIEWDRDSMHPSQESPTGCELQSLSFRHPDPSSLTSTLATLSINAKVSQAAKVAIVATIKTPKGVIELS